MPPPVLNLFAASPGKATAETIELLASGAGVRIERIVSRGEASPADFWYDQAQDEWVALLAGSATLEFHDGQPVELVAGDYLTIPAHARHRVARTSADSIWLAVHFVTGAPRA